MLLCRPSQAGLGVMCYTKWNSNSKFPGSPGGLSCGLWRNERRQNSLENVSSYPNPYPMSISLVPRMQIRAYNSTSWIGPYKGVKRCMDNNNNLKNKYYNTITRAEGGWKRSDGGHTIGGKTGQMAVTPCGQTTITWCVKDVKQGIPLAGGG